MSKASSLLKPKQDPKPVTSIRLPPSLTKFLDDQVKKSKIKGATRSELIVGILMEWSKSQGYKK